MKALFNRRPLALAAFAALLAAGPAVAQAQQEQQRQERPRQSRFIRFMDTNEDGKVTLSEITAEQKRLIVAVDVDGDGKLSAKEFRRRGRMFMRMRATTLFDLMDTNGDKVLTADEITKPSARWFARYDANGDGALVSEEMPARRFGRRGRRGQRRGAPRR